MALGPVFVSQQNYELYDLVWEPKLSIRKMNRPRPRSMLRLRIPNSESLEELYSDSLMDLHTENPFAQYLYDQPDATDPDQQIEHMCDQQGIKDKQYVQVDLHSENENTQDQQPDNSQDQQPDNPQDQLSNRKNKLYKRDHDTRNQNEHFIETCKSKNLCQ